MTRTEDSLVMPGVPRAVMLPLGVVALEGVLLAGGVPRAVMLPDGDAAPLPVMLPNDGVPPVFTQTLLVDEWSMCSCNRHQPTHPETQGCKLVANCIVAPGCICLGCRCNKACSCTDNQRPRTSILTAARVQLYRETSSAWIRS